MKFTLQRLSVQLIFSAIFCNLTFSNLNVIYTGANKASKDF